MKMTLKLGKGIVRTVDLDSLGLNSITETSSIVARHVVRMGLANVIKDSHANFKIKDTPDYLAKSNAAVDNKIKALYAGDIRISDEINMAAAVAKMTLAEVMATRTEEEQEAWALDLIAKSKARKKAQS